MKTQTLSKLKQLYETDYNQWLEKMVEQLQARNYETIDWENLIEEVIGLSKSDKRALERLLVRLFEHLLKLGYWESQREYNAAHWQAEITNFRLQILSLLEDSPSLKPFLREILPKCYTNARKIMIKRTALPPITFPLKAFATLEEVLDENWFIIRLEETE
jgi:hypothetical protein